MVKFFLNIASDDDNDNTDNIDVIEDNDNNDHDNLDDDDLDDHGNDMFILRHVWAHMCLFFNPSLTVET